MRALATAMTSTGAAAGFFQGQLDEARIWGVARTGAEIRGSKNSEVTGPATGLLGRWGFDDGTATDSSGRGINGTLFGSPSAVAGQYAFPQDVSAPGAVQNLAATPGNTTASLTWSANGESDLAGYNVYRALSTPVPTGGTPLNGGDLLQTTGFNDSGLTNGTTYHYAVIAVDGSNNPRPPPKPPPRRPGSPSRGIPSSSARATSPTAAGRRTRRRPPSSPPFPDAAVFTAGDNTYPIGAASEWSGCYDPTWGCLQESDAAGNRESRLRQRLDAGRDTVLRLLQRSRCPDRAGRRPQPRLLQLRPQRQRRHLAHRDAEQRMRAGLRPLAAGRLRRRLGAGAVAP